MTTAHEGPARAEALQLILSAVPNIGDTSARELTIARMAFDAGRASLAAIPAQVSAARSLLRAPVSHASQLGPCHCPLDKCGAPIIMGRRAGCFRNVPPAAASDPAPNHPEDALGMVSAEVERLQGVIAEMADAMRTKAVNNEWVKSSTLNALARELHASLDPMRDPKRPTYFVGDQTTDAAREPPPAPAPAADDAVRYSRDAEQAEQFDVPAPLLLVGLTETVDALMALADNLATAADGLDCATTAQLPSIEAEINSARETLRAALTAALSLPKPEPTDTNLIRRSDALAAVPGGSVCDPQKMADALRAIPAALPKPEAAEPAVRVCCQQYETCHEMCATRASYWQGQAAQLKRAAEPQESVEARPDFDAWWHKHGNATTDDVESLCARAWDAAAPPETPDHLVGAVPEGWQLTLVEPTKAMVDAAMDATKCVEDFQNEEARLDFRIGYKAALAAAPSPQGEPK